MSVKIDEPAKLFHTTKIIPLKVNNIPNIHSILDIIPLRMPYLTLDNKRFFLHMAKQICAESDHIVTISEHSRQDIIQVLGVPENKITNTYLSVDMPQSILAKTEDEIADELDCGFGLGFRDYYLFCGALEPKKNISRLIEAYVLSGATRPLLIVGGLGWMYEKDLAKIEDERFLTYEFKEGIITPKRRVRRLDFLARESLLTLMRGARAVLFPSLYEGFGLPVAEAMALGTATMTSNTSSLLEVAGEASMLVDPTDISNMSKTIRSLDHDEQLCADLRMRGLKRAKFFSAEKYSERLGDVYGRVIGCL